MNGETFAVVRRIAAADVLRFTLIPAFSLREKEPESPPTAARKILPPPMTKVGQNPPKMAVFPRFSQVIAGP